MSKKAFRELSFREKRAQFSTRISSQGRLDILPKNAVEKELEEVSLREIVDRLIVARNSCRSKRRSFSSNTPEWNRITETLCRVQGQLGMMEEQYRSAKSRTYAEVFSFCAEQMLTHQVFLAIRQATWQLMGKGYKPTKIEMEANTEQAAEGKDGGR